jgi:CRISPR/Cas system Type II protein with McrA/HNH and RuvC-like nuclease domain
MSNKHGSSWIRAEKRLAIYIRDQFTCVYCQRDLRSADKRDVTLDHITPRCVRTDNSAHNLVTACLSCNSTRRDTPLAEFATSQAMGRVAMQRNMPLNLDLARAIIQDRMVDPS